MLYKDSTWFDPSYITTTTIPNGSIVPTKVDYYVNGQKWIPGQPFPGLIINPPLDINPMELIDPSDGWKFTPTDNGFKFVPAEEPIEEQEEVKATPKEYGRKLDL